MDGDLAPGMQDPNRAPADGHADPLADQSPGHGVSIAIHLDRAIGADPAQQIAGAEERRNTAERPESLVALEAERRRLTGRAVDAQVGNVARPVVEMGFQLRPGGEAAAGDRVRFDVANAALVLAFGARAIRRAGPDPEPPRAKACSRGCRTTSRLAGS
jgi:hypothetical protein